MRPDRAARFFGEVTDRFRQLRLCRVTVHIENEDPTGLKSGEPELAPIVGEAAVMGFVAAIDGTAVDDLSVVRRSRLNVDRHELIGTISQSFDTERPDVDELFLTFDPSEIRRGTGFIRAGRRDTDDHSGAEGDDVNQ